MKPLWPLNVTGLPLCEAVRATNLNQAGRLNLGKLGKLENGYIADLVVLDSELSPISTICEGEIRWSIS